MRKYFLQLCTIVLCFAACDENLEEPAAAKLPLAAPDTADAETAADASAAQTAFAPAMGPDAAEVVLQPAQTAPDAAGLTIQNRDGELARVPLFALIPVGPSEARLLWVPWSGAGVRYTVEHNPPGPVPKWTPIRAEIGADSALVYGVGAADQLRVVAWNDENVRVGESVDLAFSPVEAAEPLLAGRNVIDGRSQGWMVGETLVSGLGSAPLEGDILLLPMGFERDGNAVREVISTSSTDRGWSATTRPFEWRPNQGARAGAAANLSLDGLPVGLLQPGNDGYRGYCSVSGWGCVEFRAGDLERPKTTRKAAREYPIIRRFWSTELSDTLGLSIVPSANAGVKLIADGSRSGFSVTGKAQVIAYAEGRIDVALSTTSSSVTDLVYPIWTQGRVYLFTIGPFDFSGEASLSAVGSYTGSSDGTEGYWSGAIQFQRGYEVGYEPRRSFYKEPISTSSLSITPNFNDGSSGSVRVGLRAVAKLYSWPVDARLTGTAELVFSHASTNGAPCAQTASIEATEIALESRLEYWLDLAFFSPWSGTLASYRTAIAAWGINRSLSVPDQLRAGAAQQFRVLSNGNPQPLASGGTPMPPINWAGLQVYVDGALAPQPTLVSGRYQFAEALPAGNHEIGVWIPEGVHPQVLRAPGVCLSRSVSVDGAP